MENKYIYIKKSLVLFPKVLFVAWSRLTCAGGGGNVGNRAHCVPQCPIETLHPIRALVFFGPRHFSCAPYTWQFWAYD